MTYPPNNDPYQNQQPPQYGTPQQPPQYGQQPPQYGTPQQPPQYGQQPPQYGAQQPQYGAPQPQYGAPQPQYGAPQQQYGAPGGYGAPAVNYASWAQRAGGYLIDALVFVPFYLLAIFLGRGDNGINLFFFVFWLAGLGLTIYNRWIQGGKTGQTWGRKALGIRLVSEETGQPIGAAMAFVRDLAHFLDSVACYVGWLFPLWDAKRQTFADKVMKTIVIS
jgi:uncharacterized RDD family membrane protein YckC